MENTLKIENIVWFSVQEKRPKEYETILIMCDCIGRSSVGYYDGEKYVIAETEIATRKKDIGCTHWAYMPLLFSNLKRDSDGNVKIIKED